VEKVVNPATREIRFRPVPVDPFAARRFTLAGSQIVPYFAYSSAISA
jgi:hypothetical protein